MPQEIRLRPYRGPTDHSQMLAVRLASRVAGIDPLSVVEPFPTAREIAETSAVEQAVAEHEGSMIGYATIASWRDQDGTDVHLHRGWVRPEFRGRGVGTAFVAWAERRITEQGACADACFAANAADVEPAAVELLMSRGYRRVFSLIEFERADLDDLPHPSLPGDVELRPVEPAHYRPIWAMNRDAYADSGNVGGWDFDWFARTAQPALWHVAWTGDEVVGAALCVAGPSGVGEVRELSVSKDWRRRGLGRALLLHGLRSLAVQEQSSVRLFTGSANPYRSYDLYQSVGFRRIAEFGRYRKPVG